MNFFEGLKKVSHNKYFWIINISSWASFLNQGYSYIFQWIFYYGMNNPAVYSLMTVIKGEAYTPGMIAAAPLTNKLGKKRVCLISLSIQIVCLVLMIFLYKNYVLLLICIFIKEMVGAVSIIYLPAMKADMMDYQQYKTGDRLEGFIEQGGLLIGSIVTLATGYVFPLIFKAYGFTNNYDDLYNADFRNPLVRIVIVCAIVGTILSIIPFLFYDLTEEKRKNMITALKLRAMFADFGNEDFDSSCVAENLELVIEAEKIYKELANYKTQQEIPLPPQFLKIEASYFYPLLSSYFVILVPNSLKPQVSFGYRSYGYAANADALGLGDRNYLSSALRIFLYGESVHKVTA